MNTWDEAADSESDGRPLHSARRRRFMRVVVSIAIASLVLPGVLVTWTTQVRTAAYACEIATAYYAPGATSSKADFRLTPAELVGWNCYAVFFDQSEMFIAHLGVIPGAPRLVPLTGS